MCKSGGCMRGEWRVHVHLWWVHAWWVARACVVGGVFMCISSRCMCDGWPFMCISSGCIRGGWRLHVSWLTCGEFASEQRVRLLGRLCAQWNLKVDRKRTKTG